MSFRTNKSKFGSPPKRSSSEKLSRKLKKKQHCGKLSLDEPTEMARSLDTWVDGEEFVHVEVSQNSLDVHQMITTLKKEKELLHKELTEHMKTNWSLTCALEDRDKKDSEFSKVKEDLERRITDVEDQFRESLSKVKSLEEENELLKTRLDNQERFAKLQLDKDELTKRLEAGMQLEQSGERSMEESLRCEREDLQDEVDRLKAGLMASKERESLLQAETEAFELQVKQYRADLSAERKDREAAVIAFADREKEWMEEIRRAAECRGHLDPTGKLQEILTCQRNETVGELNTNEQHGSDFGTHALKALIPLFYNMPHEVVLSRNCWIPFGYDSITVDRRGGSYDLCFDGLTKLKVPRNAVRGETAEIRYAIIGRGPFQLPPDYQLGSFVVYVYYNPEEITTSITLSLPTWYGRDVVPGEPPPDGLSFVLAPHTLGLQDTQYTFQLVDGGEFHDSRVHNVSIDGHSSLYAIAFKEGAKSLYLATHLMVKNNAEKNTYRIYVTYSSPTWSKILKDIHKGAEFNVRQQFEFQKPSDPPSDPLSGKLVCELEGSTGYGWAVAIDGCPELRQTEVSYEQCGYATAKELEGAVKEGLYPPNLTLPVVNNVSREEHPAPNLKLVKCTMRGADRPLQFSINVWERRRDPSSPDPSTPKLNKFLKLYKDLMLDRIEANEIAAKLFDKSLLPESVVTSIRNADSQYKANSILWSHANKHYEFQSCLTLCAVMESENGYPKMTILGTRMREKLEKNKDEYIACDNWMMDPL